MKRSMVVAARLLTEAGGESGPAVLPVEGEECEPDVGWTDGDML